MPEAVSSIRERLVLEWQGRVYGLALRMLRDRHEAEDATQDVFVRLLERADQYDPSRPAGPWVYRVATSVILNRARRNRVRRQGRTSDLPERHQRREEAPMQDAEAQAVVEAHLDELPADERVALLLHVQHGLSKQDVAQVLAEPRTTVQSRVGRAIDRMRASLEGAGFAALVPGLEGALRNPPATAVPNGLTQRLLSMAAGTAASTAAPSLAAAAVGGIVVTKNMIVAASVTALALLATGFAIGRIDFGETASPRETMSADVAELQAENDRLREALRAKAAPRLAGSEPSSTSGAVAPSAEASTGAVKPTPPKSAIAWELFAKAFAENLDLILETRNQSSQDIDPADQQKVMLVLTAYMQVSAAARALSPHPYFDARVLPDFTDAVYGSSLGLDEASRTKLKAQVDALLKAQVDGRNVGELPPLERMTLRARIQAQIEARVRAIAEEANLTEKLERVHPVASTLMRGAHQRKLIGINVPADRVENQILDVWQEVYRIPTDKLDAYRALAGELASAGRDILVQHDLLREGAEWDQDSHPEVAREMLEAQSRVESGLIRSLEPAQLAHARKKPAHLIQFSHGSNTSSVHMASNGI